MSGPSNVYLAFEDNYLWPALAHLFSGNLNSESQIKWKIVFDHRNLNLKSRKVLIEFATYFSIELDFVELVVDDNYIHSQNMSNMVYARFQLADSLSETFTFMDVDTVLLPGWDEILKLNEIPDGIVLRAAIEKKDMATENQAILITRGGGGGYFNAGIMILNPIAWRGYGLHLRYKELLSKYRLLKFEFEDQDIFNFLCFDKFEVLNSEFNFSPNSKQHVSQASAKIIHFKGLDKPWKVPSLNRPPFVNGGKWFPTGFFPLYWEMEQKLLANAFFLSEEFGIELEKIRKKAQDKNDLSLKRLLRIFKRFILKNEDRDVTGF
jgi:lipopolysaccharide biosynthesis glycosyltransferase